MAHLGRVDEGFRGLHANAVSLHAGVERNFKGAQNQIFAQARDIAALKSANGRLEEQNARLAAQVAELGGSLKLVIN